MDCFDPIFISTNDLAYLILMLSLVLWFLYFLQQLLEDYEEHET